ncbi:MAG: hypothetical protein VKJ04_07845 [Vampirovibrionales bacterium]|nr:hypothetical protein [Vampirovibrionales bacterium]
MISSVTTPQAPPLTKAISSIAYASKIQPSAQVNHMAYVDAAADSTVFGKTDTLALKFKGSYPYYSIANRNAKMAAAAKLEKQAKNMRKRAAKLGADDPSKAFITDRLIASIKDLEELAQSLRTEAEKIADVLVKQNRKK